MRDSDCIALLGDCLPRLGLRWAGFRRVRRQICRRITERMADLELADIAAYRRHLAADGAEWRILESLCRVTISRFFRDHEIFRWLGDAGLPTLARGALSRGGRALRALSAGCASGEEPYSLAILWWFGPGREFPGLGLAIEAIDSDRNLIARARAGRFRASSLGEVPQAWRDAAFRRDGETFVLDPEFRRGVRFAVGDVRRRLPRGPFDLILCRNLAFTYFAEDEQRRTLARLARRLVPGGALVIGGHEHLPQGAALVPWARAVARRSEGSAARRRHVTGGAGK